MTITRTSFETRASRTRTARMASFVLVAALAAPVHGLAQQSTSQPKTATQSATPQQPATPKPAQTPPVAPPATTAGVPPGTTPQGVAMPPDYVIGTDDVLAVMYWREKDLSADNVVVRPDGKITLPLLNDVQAAGLTPDQLREQVKQGANRFVTDPSVTIIVRQINSRKVYVTGEVNKPGPHALNAQVTVLQMLALAGGLREFAKEKEIVIMRTENGQTKSYKFNYKDVLRGKNLQQNIPLKPGDTIVVP